MRAYVKQFGNDIIRDITSSKEAAYKHFTNDPLDRLITFCDKSAHEIRRTIELTERGYITTFEAMEVLVKKHKHFTVVWNSTIDELTEVNA